MSAQHDTTMEKLPCKISVAEYLEMLRDSEIRLEYLDGLIVAMAGELPQHNEIVGNVYLELKTTFRGRKCKVYIENVKVRVSSTRYRFPDIVALCGDADFDNQNPPSLLNPQVIVEVLSQSTAEFDKGDKFREYKTIVSLLDYVLIEQGTMRVSYYARQSATQWTVTEYTNPDDVLVLTPLGVSLTLAAIYQEI